MTSSMEVDPPHKTCELWTKKKSVFEVLVTEKHSFHYSVFLGAMIEESNIPVSCQKRLLNTPNSKGKFRIDGLTA